MCVWTEKDCQRAHTKPCEEIGIEIHMIPRTADCPKVVLSANVILKTAGGSCVSNHKFESRQNFSAYRYMTMNDERR